METNYSLKLYIYTFCYNEEKILPYVIEYWKQYATKVIVYDNGSTDNSLKILSQYSWIEVREFDTENTFDPEKISQHKSFCYTDAIGKADYVMVCDIDEVLLPTENLFPELVLAKKDNVQLFQTKYYEIINNELNSKCDSLIHTMEGYYAYSNSNIHKAIVFDPQIKIAFGHNSLTYSTDIDYKTNSIITLHLKLFNTPIFTERQKHLISRLKTSYKFSSDSLYYGTDKNVGTRMSYFKLLFPYKYRFNKNENYITITDNIYTTNNQNIQFKDMVWLPAQINHNSENTNKDCIFGIPVYKSALTVTEKASLNQLCKIIGNEYELCLICPADIVLNEYFEIAAKHNIKLSTLFCAKQYFKGTKTYSFMCETADFYKCFNEYKYLFIYQLDGWIFENKVKKYLDLNVDYIGSPWDINTFHFQTETVGNGGVSLRRVEKFINICDSLTASDYLRDYVDREDLFFCKTMVIKSALKKPSVKQACGFSISGTGMQCYFMRKYNDGKLPMCLHAWHKDLKYWTKYIDLTEFNETVTEPIKTPVLQKNDYKTRLELIKMRLNNTNKPLNIQPKKVENKKEIKQNTTMSSNYSSFLASYYGIKPKNQEIKWDGYSTTQPAKPDISDNKVEEKKAEVKQGNIIKNDNILICIFNYKHDDNARRWLNLLSPYFKTYVLDSGNDKKVNDFVQFPNIYYSGLFNETKKLAEKKPYKWVGIICSDVLIDDINGSKLIEKLNWLLTTENIGQYQPAFDNNSYKWRGNNINLKYKLEGKHLLDGPIIFMNMKLFQKFPQVDTKINLYGWGISRCFSVFCTKMNYYNVFDNTLYVTHPVGTGYSSNKAWHQVNVYITSVANILNLDIKKINYSTKLSNSLGDITNQIKVTKNNYLEQMQNENKNAISYICDGLEMHNEKIEPNIVVSMTSWPKRINQVYDTIKTILDNNMKPDKICINLSTEEFPNKEKDLPDNLNKLIQTNKIIEINWLKHNTLVWKKFIPTLLKYKKSKVICIDDDRLYPKNFIETFYNASLKYPNNPLSGTNIKLYNNLITHCGPSSLNMYDFYKNRLYDLTFDMMELKSSDAFYTILADKCNHPLIYVGMDFHRLIKERPNTKDGYSNTNKLVGQKIQNIFKYLDEKISKVPEYMNNKFIDTNTKYILLPTNKPTKYLDMYKKIKSEFIQNNENFIDINDFKNDLTYYTTYNLNWHHFTLKTHYDIIIPKMDELLNFGYDKNDFELIPYFDENLNTKEKYDLSYLYPKKEYNFSIYHNGNIETGNFDLLLGFKSNIKYGPEITKYHKMYRYPHETSLITNNSINSNRILLLSGDSTNIPQIPILACYFKQILYLDTRTLHCGINFNNIQFTDTILSLFNMYPISKYLVDNFRI